MLYLKYGVDVLPSFRFLSVHTVSIFGHIARYGQWSLHPLRFASPPLSGERNPHLLTLCPRKKSENLSKLIYRTHHKRDDVPILRCAKKHRKSYHFTL